MHAIIYCVLAYCISLNSRWPTALNFDVFYSSLCSPTLIEINIKSYLICISLQIKNTTETNADSLWILWMQTCLMFSNSYNALKPISLPFVWCCHTTHSPSCFLHRFGYFLTLSTYSAPHWSTHPKTRATRIMFSGSWLSQSRTRPKQQFIAFENRSRNRARIDQSNWWTGSKEPTHEKGKERSEEERRIWRQ